MSYPDFHPTEEKRFAVVMYGGVSLAVYINGVAQELFHLVESTAPGTDPGTLTGSAGVYRALAEHLGARFVVDILSGTSAGGINAAFLAKALANDEKLDQLEAIWLDEANIERLINDRRSTDGTRTDRVKASTRSPRSLLNGARLYEKVLDALRNMDGMAPTTRRSLVEDLDLFLTTTDLQGLPVPIRLSDRTVLERRHRHVFRFRTRRDGPNDFTDDKNEMLAFAARCTSSFPFAFEPVVLRDYSASPEKWATTFFDRYQIEPREGDYATRAFADGGYLDNKPFTYAIDTLAERHCDLPVDRKLLYVEPSPEILDPEEPVQDPPDALANSLKALTLARYETIRHDLDLIRRRNRLLEEAERILRGTDEDLNRRKQSGQPVSAQEWFASDLDDMIRQQGIAYAGYLRLRVARLTDDLSRIMAAQARVAPDSDEFLGIRNLVRGWRDERYTYYTADRAPVAGPAKKSFTEFILDLDLGFHLRRLRFAVGKVDDLLAWTESTGAAVDARSERARHILDARRIEPQRIRDANFRSELRRLRSVLSAARRDIERLVALRRSGDQGGDTRLAGAVRDVGLQRRVLVDILSPMSDTDQRAKAKEIVDRKAGEMERVYEALKAHVEAALTVMTGVKADVGLAAGLRDEREVRGSPTEHARWVIAFYIRMFPLYDLVTYPILNEAEVGEEIDQIEVFRISPRYPGLLGGSRLGHFGGFFDRTWRENDILRGRLDGADQIVASLLPGPERTAEREEWQKRVRDAITADVLAKDDKPLDLLVQIMLGATPESRDALAGKLHRPRRQELEQALEPVVRRQVTGEELGRRFASFEVDREIEPSLFVRSLARSVRVAGQVVQRIGDRASAEGGQRLGGWMASVGAIATGLLDVLMPGSWIHVLGRRLLSLLMLFGVVLLVLNALFHTGGMGAVAGLLVGGSALLMLLSESLGRAVRTRRLRPLLVIPALAAVALLVVGVAYTPTALADVKEWIGGLFRR